MARKLRKGRERCGATRRDGHPCQAPAVAEALVCLKHGGAAPQVLIASKHRQLQLALFVATREFEDAKGTDREFEALCRALRAGRALDAYEVKLAYLAELRDEVAQRRTEDGWIRPAGAPPIVRLAQLQRRVAEMKRWKPRKRDPMDASPSHAREVRR